ncbi:hypothetical protein [Xenophilus sp. Marseille-Q4582]|uniref:hypothetical protein n=1 Tax=Xenophilus sp. Marseille-Q4582 TaxID=2866600 RepID=UPI001CE43A7D|nr:hypothetical protein [Xenophilus sp. Marseille-Q4582]
MPDPKRSDATPLHDDAMLPGGQVVSGGGEGRPALDFDDEEIYSGRAKARRSAGTTEARGGDSGRVAPPAEQLAPTNRPSDPDAPDGHGIDSRGQR